MTDAEIIQRVLDGDTDAYTLIVQRYRDRGGRFAARMLGDIQEAEEALQDAFVRAHRSLDRCDDREHFDRWFFSILANRCRTRGSRIGVRERVFVAGDDALARHHAGDDGAVEADRRAWRQEIGRALAQLDVDQREAFLLKHVEDLSYEEMAEITGVGVSALKMRVKRACERLRAMLEEVYVNE